MKRISTVGPKSCGGDGYLRPVQFLDHLTVIISTENITEVQGGEPPILELSEKVARTNALRQMELSLPDHEDH